MHRAGAWKSDAWTLFALLAIPTVLTADVLVGNTFFYRDLASFFYGSDHVFREIVSAGEIPFWNPYFAAGQPFAANPEFSVFYPPRWLVLLPDFRLGFNLQLLLHLHLAIVGMYLLLRSMKLSRPAASFGALAFGIGGFTCSYLNIPPFLFTMCWAPLVLMFSRMLVLRPSRLAFVLTALCFGMQNLAGEPTGILQTVVLVGAVFLFESFSRPAGERLRFFTLRSGLLGGAMLSGLLVAAVQVFGTLDLVRDTARASGLSYSIVSRWSMPPLRLLEFVFPSFMGHKTDAGTLYWGVAAYASAEGPYILDLYVGYLTAVFFLAGAFVRQREWILWTSLAAISFLISFGDHTPLLRLLYDLGLFRAFRYPEKFVFLGMIPLIVQSATAFDALLERDRRTVRAATATSAAILVVAAAMLAFSFSERYADALRTFWSVPSAELTAMIVTATRTDWSIAAVRGAIALILIASLLRVQPGRKWLACAALFILYDLGTTSNRDLPRVGGEYFDPPPAALELRRQPGRLFHEADLFEQEFGAPRAAAGEARYSFAREGLYPKLPALWGIPMALETDYDLTHLEPTRSLYAALLLATMKNGGVVPPVFLQISGIGSVAMRTNTGIAFQRTGPHPKYYFARRLIRYRGFEDFVSAAAIGKWRAFDAFVDFPPPESGEAEIAAVEERFNSVQIDVRVRQRAFLVMATTPHRYWRASIDGAPARLLSANLGYQGIVIPSGARRVELRYSNPASAAGAVVSGITMLSLLFLLLARGRRRVDDFATEAQ